MLLFSSDDRRSKKRRKDRKPVDLPRSRCTCEFSESRKDIGLIKEQVANLARLNSARPSDDEWNAQSTLVEIPFSTPSCSAGSGVDFRAELTPWVLTRLEAVLTAIITSEQNDCVVFQI